MSAALNDRQRLFVREYLVDLNATQAAIRAGYSARSAAHTGERLKKLPAIRDQLQCAMDKRAERLQVTADDVLKGLARIAFADLRHLFDSTGALLPPADWPDDVAASVAGADFITRSKGEGAIEQVARIKANDRLKALELLGRHLVMFSDRVETSISHDIAESLLAARTRVNQPDPAKTTKDDKGIVLTDGDDGGKHGG